MLVKAPCDLGRWVSELWTKLKALKSAVCMSIYSVPSPLCDDESFLQELLFLLPVVFTGFSRNRGSLESAVVIRVKPRWITLLSYSNLNVCFGFFGYEPNKYFFFQIGKPLAAFYSIPKKQLRPSFIAITNSLPNLTFLILKNMWLQKGQPGEIEKLYLIFNYSQDIDKTKAADRNHTK